MSLYLSHYDTHDDYFFNVFISPSAQGGLGCSTPPPVLPKKWTVKKNPGGFDSVNGINIVKVTLFYVLLQLWDITGWSKIFRQVTFIVSVECSVSKAAS